MIAPAFAPDSNRRSPDRREGWIARRGTNAKPLTNEIHRGLDIECVLKRARLTMVELSRRTRVRFGERSLYFVPPTFLYKQRAGVTPHVCQVVALSEVTGCRFADWMKLCGFDLELIFELQLKIPYERTTIITPTHSFIGTESAFNLSNLPEHQKNRYCYAKIGTRDAVLYPLVRPGSIVRADAYYSPELLNDRLLEEHLWLVEHPAGITCCRVKSISSSEVILLPRLAPLSAWPLHLSRQVHILGLVDTLSPPYQETEINPLDTVREPRYSAMSLSGSIRMNVSDLLRASRLRTGLTFREAHRMTLRIADLLRNADFGISMSLLSDYEATNKIPRHIAKIMTLCVIYGIDPSKLLSAGGIHINDSEKRRFTDAGSLDMNIGVHCESPENHALFAGAPTTRQNTNKAHQQV